MDIEEVLENIKRHLEYVNATKQKSIRDTEIEVMYKEIKRLNNIIREVREYTSKTQMPEGYKKMILEMLNKGE